MSYCFKDYLTRDGQTAPLVKVDGDRPSQKVALCKKPWWSKTNGSGGIAIWVEIQK